MALTSNRRRFLYAGGAAAILGGAYPLVRSIGQDPAGAWRPGPFGPMRPDPDRILDLPEGFSYRVIQHAATAMDDGHRVPARPDGMACFQLATGELALMRNHENPAGLSMLGPFVESARPPEAWSSDGMGGVTRVVLDPITFERRSSNLVLAGTILNCAGGPSPFGWLSCEEAFAPRHGLVFACDPTADRIAPARPIHGYGKIKHEAVCVDPITSIAYLTEDREDGCLYRFVPRAPETPFDGELQALAVRGAPAFDTALAMRTGDRLEVEWIAVLDPAPPGDVVRYHARRAGAASVCRGEGIAFEPARAGATSGSVVITASAGGPNHTGQIFRLIPEGDGGELVLLAQSERRSDFDMPDNVAIAPSGAVYFCEDGQDRNWLRGLDAEGRVFDFARNAASRSELAGACFSPDGRAMFVNLQEDGLTLAITGPFEQGAPRAA